MQINTRLVAPMYEGDSPERYEAFRPDMPGDWRVLGIGPTPLDAVQDFIEKTKTMLARVEAETPVDVHVQLRDAKALLQEFLQFRRTYHFPSTWGLSDRVEAFLQEHCQ